MVGLLRKLIHLSYGLSVVLAFIGVKLVLHGLHETTSLHVPESPLPVSLGVICGVLVITTITGLAASKKASEKAGTDKAKPADKADAQG